MLTISRPFLDRFGPFWDHFRPTLNILRPFRPILTDFGPFWFDFDYFESILDRFRRFWTILVVFWTILTGFGPFRTVLDEFWAILHHLRPNTCTRNTKQASTPPSGAFGTSVVGGEASRPSKSPMVPPGGYPLLRSHHGRLKTVTCGWNPRPCSGLSTPTRQYYHHWIPFCFGSLKQSRRGQREFFNVTLT